MGRSRRRKGRPVHGWLVLDKPAGITSAKAAGAAKRLLDAAKVGHGGTLDPMATGVLPLAFGEATKTVAYVMDGPKAYTFTVAWGEARATEDAEGDVTEASAVRPTEDAIRDAIPAFIGDIRQIPPAFSAIKVGGRRAYELARADETPELRPRNVHIERLELVRMVDRDHAEFEVSCGKGTYIRSLARDLAQSLGTVGHLSGLRRTRAGPFSEQDAISLDKLEALGHIAAAEAELRPVEDALDDIPALVLTEDEARRLRRGQPVSALQVARRTPLSEIDQGAVVCAMAEGKPVALATFDGGEIRPFRVLNL